MARLLTVTKVLPTELAARWRQAARLQAPRGFGSRCHARGVCRRAGRGMADLADRAPDPRRGSRGVWVLLLFSPEEGGRWGDPQRWRPGQPQSPALPSPVEGSPKGAKAGERRA